MKLSPFSEPSQAVGAPGAAPSSRFDRAVAPMPQETGGIARHRRDTYYRRALGLADLLSAVLALTVAVQAADDNHLRLWAILAVPLVVLVSKVAGLYDRDELLLSKTTLDEAPKLFQAATLYTLLIWLCEPVVVDAGLAHLQVLGLWGLLFASMWLCRAVARRLVRPLAATEACLVVGDQAAAGRLAAKLAATGRVAAEV